MRLPHPHPSRPLDPLESLASLLNQVKRDNHYEEANWLDSLLPLPVPGNLNILERADHFARLSELTELSVDMLWHLTLHRFAPRYILPSQSSWETTYSPHGARVIWDASRTAMYVHGQPNAKLCPLCWREKPSMLLPWSLRHVTTCARHHVLLVDHCSQCGSNLQVNWEKGICRTCEFELADLRVLSISGHRASVAVTALIWSALGCSDEPFPSLSLDLPLKHLVQTLSPPAVLEFFWQFGQLLVGRAPQWPLFDTTLLLLGTSWNSPPAVLRQASVAEVHGVLTALWQLLEGWPRTWEMTLEHLVKIEGPFATDAPQRLPHLLTTQFSAPEFAWMYRGWEDFMWKHRSHMASLYPWLRHWRRTQQQQESRQGSSLLSRREAAQRLHRGERSLKQLLDLEHLQTPPVPPRDPTDTQRHWRLIESESVERVQRTLEAELTLEQAATTCGISKKSVLALVKAGVLAAVRGPAMDHAPVWAFSESTIHDTLTHLLSHVPMRLEMANAGHEFYTLRQALRVTSAAAMGLPEVLQAIQTGQLASFRLGNDLKLSSLCFERGSLEPSLAERHLPERSELLTVQQVLNMLQCSTATLRRWYTTKLLMPHHESTGGTKRYWLYRRQDVQAFVERYVTTQEAAAILGCSELTVQTWARASLIPAVSGPEIDGAHSYRFEKAVLIQQRTDRTSSKEVMQVLGISKATLHRWVLQGKLNPLSRDKGKHRWFSRREITSLANETARDIV